MIQFLLVSSIPLFWNLLFKAMVYILKNDKRFEKNPPPQHTHTPPLRARMALPSDPPNDTPPWAAEQQSNKPANRNQTVPILNAAEWHVGFIATTSPIKTKDYLFNKNSAAVWAVLLPKVISWRSFLSIIQTMIPCLLSFCCHRLFLFVFSSPTM